MSLKKFPDKPQALLRMPGMSVQGYAASIRNNTILVPGEQQNLVVHSTSTVP
jgi:hypothetical protein